MSTSPSTNMVATPPTSESNQPKDSKPIKLRSACNACFAAKVRCDGNKEGCKRCEEKHLDCTYSESRVGKVVGKRRKRPLPEPTTSESWPNQWNFTAGPATLPSPAPTQISERPSKRDCTTNDWTSLISYDEQSPLDLSNYQEHLLSLGTSETGTLSTADDMSYMLHPGLLTPSMSPPEIKFVSSSGLEAPSGTSPLNMPPADQGVNVRHLQPGIQRRAEALPQDDETICIKLLAHLKRFSQRQQSYESVLWLVQKTNATLRRLLRSRTIRADYMCHLLLTNIVLRLATFCKQLIPVPQPQNTPCENEFVHDSYLVDGTSNSCDIRWPQNDTSQDMRASAKNTVKESTIINSGIGDLLKRKPLNGFQVLGRHESAHLEIDIQLRRILASLA